MLSHSRRFSAVAMLSLVSGIAACGAPDEHSVDPLVSVWSEQLRLRISDSSLPDEIRSVLEEAIDAGEMSFDLYDKGMKAYGTCLEEAGLSLTLVGPVEGGDGLLQYMTQVQYPAGVKQGDALELTLSALAEECSRDFEYPIVFSYIGQPSAIEARELRFLEYRDSLIACLEENGSTLDHDATEEEVVTEINRIAETGPDCGLKTGYWTPY